MKQFPTPQPRERERGRVMGRKSHILAQCDNFVDNLELFIIAKSQQIIYALNIKKKKIHATKT